MRHSGLYVYNWNVICKCDALFGLSDLSTVQLASALSRTRVHSSDILCHIDKEPRHYCVRSLSHVLQGQIPGKMILILFHDSRKLLQHLLETQTVSEAQTDSIMWWQSPVKRAELALHSPTGTRVCVFVCEGFNDGVCSFNLCSSVCEKWMNIRMPVWSRRGLWCNWDTICSSSIIKKCTHAYKHSLGLNAFVNKHSRKRCQMA